MRQHDLTVGADVDDQRRAAAAPQICAEHHAHDVAADIARNRRRHPYPRRREHRQVELGRPERNRVHGGRRKRRIRDARRIDTQQQVRHHRVADERGLIDAVRTHVGGLQAARGDAAYGIQDRPVQPLDELRTAHRGAHAADHVAAVDVLAVDVRCHGDLLPGRQVHERADHRRGADIEGQAVRLAGGIPSLDRYHPVARDHHGYALADRLADGPQPAQRIPRRIEVAGGGGQLVLHQSPVGAWIVEARRCWFDINLLDVGIQTDTPQAGAFHHAHCPNPQRMRIDGAFVHRMLAGQAPAAGELGDGQPALVMRRGLRHRGVADEHPAGAAGSLAGAHRFHGHVVRVGGVEDRGADLRCNLAIFRQESTTDGARSADGRDLRGQRGDYARQRL